VVRICQGCVLRVNVNEFAVYLYGVKPGRHLIRSIVVEGFKGGAPYLLITIMPNLPSWPSNLSSAVAQVVGNSGFLGVKIEMINIV